MIEIDEESLAEFKDDIGDLSDGLDRATNKRDPESIYKAIERAVDREIINPVLQNARRLAQEHVGERAQTIRPVTGNWEGDTYIAGITTDNEVVLSHEYGSGQYTTTGKYKIEPNGDYPLAFEIDGRPIRVDYVMHPGVRGKRFMQKAMRDRQDQIAQDALDEVQETLGDLLG